MSPRQQRLEGDIADLVRGTPGEWNEIRLHVCANVNTTGSTASANVRLVRPPKRVTPAIESLRESMADAQRGAWLMADIVVPRSGDATFTYDWMTKPDWPTLGGHLVDSDYLDDLAKFPRTPDNIPDWYPRADAGGFIATPEDPAPAAPRRGDSPDVPLTGLSWPFGVAVDSAGTLYVTDTANNQVVALTAAAGEPEVLPFSGLREPCGVAVDTTGTLYIADSLNDRILALPAGASNPTELPVPGLRYPGGIAVDEAGALYITDRGNHRVLKLTNGDAAPTVLPFNGISDPLDVSVDNHGSVYATDGTMHGDSPLGGRLLKLSVGAEKAEQSLTGRKAPFGVTVNTDGDIYISEKLEHGRILKLAAGPHGSLTVAVGDLQKPAGIALDGAGNIFIAETAPDSNEQDSGRVVKIAV